MTDQELIRNGLASPPGSRIDELTRYRILGTPAESEFDDVAELAAHLAQTPIAYISFLDETDLWFKATVGFSAESIPRGSTYCQYVVDEARPIVIADTEKETRYVPEPLVDHDLDVRFYVGVPLRSRSGYILGTLCTVDTQPRELPDRLVPMLEKLASQVIAQLEVRRINRVLLDERDTFSTLFEAAPAPLILSEDGRIIRTNFAFTDLVTDADTDSLIGRKVSDFLASVPDEPGPVLETRLTNEIGVSVPVLVTLTRLLRDQRTYDLVTLTDITDRKEKERVLKEQRIAAENANRIKDTFLSLVSHDLRSPLSGISTMLELLDQAGHTFTKEEWRSSIRDLREASAVLVEMINQLLNIHRLQSGRIEVQIEPVDVLHIARQVVLSLGKQIKDKALSVDLDIPDDTELNADIGLFREALFNLVSNAIKFSHTGGEIRIGIEGESVFVEDQGAGVDPADIADLFRHEIKTSRPGTAGERGTGLGLPLVADIMKAHGGRIAYDESYAKGARFVLDFGKI